MILLISNINQNNSKFSKTNFSTTKSYIRNANNFFLPVDSFNRSDIVFTGANYPSGYYEDDEIKIARKFMNQRGNEWKKTFRDMVKQDGFDLFGKSHGLFHITRIFGKDAPELTRAVSGVGSAGLTEIVNAPVSGAECLIRKYADNKSIIKKTNRIAMLINDIVAEEEANKINPSTSIEFDKLKYREEVSKIKNKIRTEFSDRIDMEQKGTKVEIPNAIMMIDEHNDLSKELVDWTGKNSDCNFVKLENADNKELQRSLGKTLNEAKETFTKNKRRTLISVEGFDQLITEGSNTRRNIASLKDIMCRSAEDFGSTIIFRTKDATKLVKEAIQPHRVAAKILVTLKSMK